MTGREEFRVYTRLFFSSDSCDLVVWDDPRLVIKEPEIYEDNRKEIFQLSRYRDASPRSLYALALALLHNTYELWCDGDLQVTTEPKPRRWEHPCTDCCFLDVVGDLDYYICNHRNGGLVARYGPNLSDYRGECRGIGHRSQISEKEWWVAQILVQSDEWFDDDIEVQPIEIFIDGELVR
jgi:hypothetical protein